MHLAFQKLGQNVPMEEVNKLIKIHDLEENGVINFEEFKDIFLKGSHPITAER